MALNEYFTTNDLEELSIFTGCVFSQDVEKGGLGMTQNTFIKTLARRFNVTTTSPSKAPPDVNLGVRMEGESSGMLQEAYGPVLTKKIFISNRLFKSTFS